MPRRHFTVLLLASLAAAPAAAGELEFEPPPDVLFGAGEFNMPLPPTGGAMHAMPGMPFDLVMLAEHLELTPEQRDKAGLIMDETMPKLRALMFRMIDARKAGRELKTGDASDQELRKFADGQGEIVAEMTYLGLKARSDLRALLSEEQRRKLDAFGDRRGPFVMHRFGHMGGMDPAGMPSAPGARAKELKL
jgi:Spy/CpxP family protein refolding chaperone